MRKSLTRQRVAQFKLFHPPRSVRLGSCCLRNSGGRQKGCWRDCCASTSEAVTSRGAKGGRAMMDKIKPHHLEGKAILYIRQSTAYQVSHNLESQKLQYAMQDRLQQLGWREIEVVDEDLGRSAAGTVTRAGFERMVAEVGLGKVGAVAAREVSRLARNSRECQQLVEVCRVVDTLVVDHETSIVR